MKFSDNSSEFELFLFSEILINNREKLKESSSFVLTLIKDKQVGENLQRRINVRKIVDLSEMINKPYEKVSIELDKDTNLSELKETLRQEGETEVEIIVRNKNKKLYFKLERPRKFDLSIFNRIKSKQYVKKISF